MKTMILNNPIIGERIYLRSLDVGDASDEYCSWLNDPDVNKFLETKRATLSSLISFITQKNQQSDALFFGIFIKATNHHLGTIKLDKIDSVEGNATLAVMVGDKNYWGQGYGSEAMKILMDYAKKNLNVHKIELGVVAQNFTAINAYVKLGFLEEKGEKDTVRHGSESHDHITMCLTLK